jgi:hypothetical protein
MSAPPCRLPILVLCGGAILAACEPYRIEYHRRPAYYDRMVDGPLPDRVVLDDGTILVYNADPDDPPKRGEDTEKAEFRMRQELPDGSIVLRSVLPEHVIANTLDCLRNEEYDLLWDQVLAERTKQAYAARGMGAEEFKEFCREYRIDLARMLNRMLLGMASHEVVFENVEPGVFECRFWPTTASLFKFKKVTMAQEEFQLKLVLIH